MLQNAVPITLLLTSAFAAETFVPACHLLSAPPEKAPTSGKLPICPLCQFHDFGEQLAPPVLAATVVPLLALLVLIEATRTKVRRVRRERPPQARAPPL